MKVCYVCKAVDETNATVATQVRWIRALAHHPQVDRVRVLTRHVGTAELPTNVSVHGFGAQGWPRTVLGFYREALRLRRSEVDWFFVAQGGPYPALLLPLKRLFDRPLYQWKAHPHISRRMRFYARYCDDLIFTPTPASFPMALDSVRVVGHGIDTDLFRPAQGPKIGDVVAIGRIAPVKRLEVAIEALGHCRDEWGLQLALDIVGPCRSRDENYRQRLVALVEQRGLSDQVRFHGSVHHDEVPRLLGQYRMSVNFSQTAFDKAAGEAMAAGVPVVTTNPCSHEMLPDDIRPVLAAKDDIAGVAGTIREVASWDEPTRERMGHRLRETVVADHSLVAFFDKIIGEIEAEQRTPAGRAVTW